MSFWDFVVYVFWSTVFISYLMVLFGIAADIFRDDTLNGWMKALWILFLVFVPVIAALVYLIARGRDMSGRQVAVAERARAQADAYDRSASTVSPADEIAKARALLDSGSITRDEFEGLKTRAMMGPVPQATSTSPVAHGRS
jgi:hypothetical protein